MLLILSIGFALCCNAQNSIPTSDVLIKVGVGWKEDSLACKGYRKSVAQSVLNSKIDSVSKDFLVLQFGQPRRIQRFSSGLAQKSYVGYIYYFYLDQCPKIEIEATAIQFIFEDGETSLVEIEEIDYCG